ncbi:SF1B family DNA helicase RecD2 [Thermovenabulum gondwanense]|uniref:ATP-dependent RecD2 DNA helicase n=1 Tax=Thermovenabulum gondwanense TaxID=520767 RepID=A0A162MW10_9FIRM|nr:ATP-dependent RecD-like DNA helicase [Thermovenabulum gondwanense]KYO67978.1 ATP-dependent RecD-like DNA helicase [Thermovenabulum gondwanense]
MTTFITEDLSTVYEFLASGFIRGIGESTARRIIEHFKENTLEVLKYNPERLMEIDGIKKKKYKMILESLQSFQGILDAIIFLRKYDLKVYTVLKVCNILKEEPLGLIKKNPYLLMGIDNIDFFIADRIARSLDMPGDDENRIAAGIRHILLKATEEGHVFLPLKDLLLQLGSLLSLDIEKLRYILKEGQDKITFEDIAFVKIKEEDRVYLKSFYNMEKSIARKIFLISSENHSIKIDGEEIEEIEKSAGVKLAEKQRQALFKAAENRIIIITGGPGTGKTTLIKCLNEFFRRRKMKVALCAPTGRAAKRIAEATSCKAFTLHRLLEYGQDNLGNFARSKENPLEEDVIIVDEMSMVDVSLMYHLLSALKEDARIILVGDKDQLPSVGPGCVLRDLIACGKIETIFLDQIFRQAGDSLIAVNAHRINKGYIPYLNRKNSDFFLLQAESPEEILKRIIELVCERIPAFGNYSPMEDIQVITPMKKTLIGVENLNKNLQEVLNPKGQNKKELIYKGTVFRQSDRVMQIKNNYQKDVFNGDIGKIVDIKKEGEIVVVYQDMEGEKEVAYKKEEIEELTLAYALSVHKSQGSEYPVVVMPISFAHYSMLDRNLLYTAVTRAKKLLVLVGTKQALFYAVKNVKNIKRYSGLRDFLEEKFEL